jgi:DNA invertase Pin-like site-specific DNA recombinase
MSKIARLFKPPRFAKYLRKSREEKDLSTEEVLKSHNNILNEVCTRMNIKVDEEDTYKELVTGESISLRPQMQKLLTKIEEGYYDGVLVYEVQRLCRGNGIDQAVIIETLKSTGTKIITPNKVYDPSNNDADEEYLEFGLFMSRREYKTINRRLMDGKISAFKMGKFINSVAPTGYTKVKLKGNKGYTLEINEEEAFVIREMFRLFVDEGLSVTAIAIKFQNDNMPNRSGTSWSASMIRNYLNNATYAGYLTYNKRQMVKHLTNGDFSFSRPVNKDYLIQKGMHPPIISEETFKKTQEKLKRNSVRYLPKEYTLKNPLSGLIYCGICGKAMIRRINKYKGNDVEYLKCETIKCSTVASHMKSVEKKVIELLKKELKDYRYYLDNYEKEVIKEHKNYDKEIKKIDKNIKDINNQLLNALVNFNSSAITSEEYQSLKIYLTDKKNALESTKNELKKHMENDKVIVFRKRVPILENCINKYFELSIGDKNKLLKTLIKRIEYFKTESSRHKDVEIVLNITYKITV